MTFSVISFIATVTMKNLRSLVNVEVLFRSFFVCNVSGRNIPFLTDFIICLLFRGHHMFCCRFIAKSEVRRSDFS